MTTKRKNDSGRQESIAPAVAAKQARVLRLLAKRTLALLDPDDSARDARVAAFDRAMDEEMGS
jgi:hypothetical protein